MSRFRYTRGGVLIAWLVIGAIVAGSSAAESLFVIPTESPPMTVSVADTEPLRIALHAGDVSELARVLGVAAPASEKGILQYVIRDYSPIGDTTERTWIESTFVIDYREAGVQRLSNEFAKSQSKEISKDKAYIDSLIRFVAGKVHGTYDRGFDVASEVAVRGEGDCKQNAVLTVALARAAGIPARFVTGLAVLRSGRRYSTFGHAWAELRIQGRWVVADAALVGAENPPRYVPFGVLQNESMGYGVDLARMTSVWVQSVDVLGGAAERGNAG